MSNGYGRHGLPAPCVLWDRVDRFVLGDGSVYSTLRQFRLDHTSCFEAVKSLQHTFDECGLRMHRFMEDLTQPKRCKRLLRGWMAALTDPRILVGVCDCGDCTGVRGLFLLQPMSFVKDAPALADVLVGVYVKHLAPCAARKYKPHLRYMGTDARLVGPLSLLNTHSSGKRNHFWIGHPSPRGGVFKTVRCKARVGHANLQPCELLLDYNCNLDFDATDKQDSGAAAAQEHHPRVIM